MVARISLPPVVPSLVSVIVPTYNYGHFIGQTLESLQSQSYRNWECLIVDDGSTDNTDAVVALYMEKDRRIKFFRQKNQRQGAAKNTALGHSSGQYIQFLDADDLIESRKLEQQVEYLERHPDVDIVYGEVRYFNTGHPEQRFYDMWGANSPWMSGISGQGIEVVKSLVRLNTIPINAPLVRRNVIERVGFFDERLPPVEDWDYWVRCAIEGVRFQYQDFEEALALVRSHPSSTSKSSLNVASATLLMRRKHQTILVGEDVRRLNDQLVAEGEGIMGSQEVLHGRLAKGVFQLYKAGVLDRKFKHKLKWLTCALIAPFVSKQRFGRVFSTSISQLVADSLRRRQT